MIVQTSVEAEVAVNARAEALGVASLSEGALDLTGSAVVGAFVEGSVEVPTRVDVAGVRTRVTGQLSGYAGAGAKAVFRIRVNPASGKLLLETQLGAALGIGGSAGVRVEVDASELFAWLGAKPAPPSPPKRATPGAVGALRELRSR